MDVLKTHRRGFFLAGLGTLLLALTTPLYAATFVVDSTADAVDAAPGDTICADSQNRCTLRAAVMEANATSGTDTIDLSGINDPNSPIMLTIAGTDETTQSTTGPTPYEVVTTHDASKGDLNITESVNITGAGSDKTIIEWAPSVKSDPSTGDRVFHIEAVSTNVEVNMTGLTVQNGVTPAPVTLETLPDNTYYQFKRSGAGIAIGAAAAISLINPNTTGGGDGGPPTGGEGETSASITGVTLTDVNILDNQSGGDGGGLYNTAPLTVSGGIISGNTATANGGGVYNDAAMAMVNTTVGTKTGFANPNTAEGGGGIFDTGFHTTTINDSTIAGNSATGGGGISARSLIIVDITNSTIDGNSASDVGGGITTNGTVNLKNATLADNTAASDSTGGGAGLNSFGNGTYNFVNTLFSNNQTTGTTPTVVSCGCSGGGGCPAGRMVSGGHNLADDNSCSLSGTGDLPNTDALLEALADNGGPTETRALSVGPPISPAVDAGDDTNCPNNDQRGSIRPADGDLDNTLTCDIGAFELFIATADLHINNMTAPDSVYTGEAANVSVEIHNDINATADATGVTLTTDALPAAYSATAATITTPGGTSNCTIDSGTQVVTCNVGTLTKDETATFNLTGSVITPGKITITANVTAGAPADTHPENNTASVNIQVEGQSDLSVTASGPSSSVEVNSGTTVNFNVENMGPDAANNVRLLATLPTSVTFKAMNPSAGSCTLQSDNFSVLCTLGTLAANASVTGTLDVTANTAQGSGDITFQAVGDEKDTDNTNDSSVVTLAFKAVESSGGCTLQPGGAFDPTLPAVIAAGLMGLALRRRQWAGTQGT